MRCASPPAGLENWIAALAFMAAGRLGRYLVVAVLS
jgi:hypothetical protein